MRGHLICRIRYHIKALSYDKVYFYKNDLNVVLALKESKELTVDAEVTQISLVVVDQYECFTGHHDLIGRNTRLRSVERSQ